MAYKARKDLLEIIKGSTLFNDAVRELEASQVDERREILAELEEIEAVMLNEVAGLAEKERHLLAEAAGLKAALEAAQSKIAEIRYEWNRAVNGADARKKGLRCRLEETSDPRIGEFIAWAITARSQVRARSFNATPLATTAAMADAHASVRALVTRCAEISGQFCAAIEEAGQMRYEAIGHTASGDRLRAQVEALTLEAESVGAKVAPLAFSKVLG